VDIFTLAKRPWPTTLIAWYGDSQFGTTLLRELGWTIISEAELDDIGVSRLFDESERRDEDQPSTHLILRTVSRWNLLVWPNDAGGALDFLNGMPLAMPVFETTLGKNATRVKTVVGLGWDRKTLESTGDSIARDGVALNPDVEWIKDRDKTIGARWKFQLTNSLGLPTAKSLIVYIDPKRTLTEMGASDALFDFSGEGLGRLVELRIAELTE
jgi:hypothetical protein